MFVFFQVQERQVFAQPHQNLEFVYLKENFLSDDFAVIVAEVNDHLKYFDGGVLNSLGKNKPLGFRKFVDRWINPFHKVVRFLEHFCVRHCITKTALTSMSYWRNEPRCSNSGCFLNTISCCQAHSSH